MKKKIISLILVLALSLSILMLSASADYGSEKTVLSLDAVWVEDGETPQIVPASSFNSIQYSVDIAGQTHGPSDFFVKDNNVYVLNNSNNTISQYANGVLMRQIQLDDYGVNAIKMAQSDGDIYVFGTDLTVTKVSPNNESTKLNYSGYLDGESITNFLILDDTLYISTTELDGGKTYSFDITNDSVVDRLGYFNGRIIDDGTIYLSELNTEEDKLLGRTGTITITRPNGDTISIDVESDYYLGGIELIRCNSDGTYDIKICEITQDEDYVIYVDEVVRRVKANGDVVCIYAPSEQVLAVGNQTRTFDGVVYQMNNLNNEFKVVELPSYYSVSEETYISPLSQYTMPTASEVPEVTTTSARAAVYLSRNDIMTNARSYHSSFYWTCTSNNLQELDNWEKPSYVVAGTNQYMPYCWGGNDTTESFQAGINAGGRVGNVKSNINLGHISGTYGQDCSGYVGRCWGQSQKYATYTIDEISRAITFNELQPGDALNDADSHIILFYRIDHGDYLDLFECTTTNDYDRVANTGRYWSELSGKYTPIRYDYVTN